MDQLLGALDAAGTDPHQWEEVCTHLARYAGARGSVVFGDEIELRRVPLPHSPSLAEVMDTYVREGWYERDLRAERSIPLALRRGVVSDHDIMDEVELAADPMLTELVRPAGLQWVAAAAVQVGGRAWAMAVHRTPEQGPFQPAELAALRGLRRPFRLAIRRAKALGHQRVETLEGILGVAGLGLAMLDAAGRILFMNEMGEALLRAADLLRGGGIAAGDNRDGRALEACLADALNYARRGPARLPAPVRWQTSYASTLLIDALPMPRDFQSIVAGSLVLVTVRRVESDPADMLLRARFGLTTREAELAGLLEAGSSPEEIASALGMSVATVRQHLKSIFRKTGTHRQGELIALITRQR